MLEIVVADPAVQQAHEETLRDVLPLIRERTQNFAKICDGMPDGAHMMRSLYAGIRDRLARTSPFRSKAHAEAHKENVRKRLDKPKGELPPGAPWDREMYMTGVDIGSELAYLNKIPPISF